MPELSRFFGIAIRMFVETGERHHRPHFHDYHQGRVAVIAVQPVEILAGSLPPREEHLALAWAEIHKEQLQRRWDELQAGRLPGKIEPLR